MRYSPIDLTYAEYRAYRRMAPKSLELVQPVAQTFCGRLLLQHLAYAAYFDPGTWLAKTN